MARDNLNSDTPDLAALKFRATNLRRHMLTMARGQGSGYIGQGLGIADLLAALYFHELRYDPDDTGLAGARPLPALDRTLLDRALGGAGGGGNSAGVGAADLRRRRQPPCDEHARHDAGRRDHRRLARPRPRPGRRPGARPQARRLAGAGLRRTVRRRDAGGIDLGGGDVRLPFQARQPRRPRRLQRHPGRRRDRPRHGAGGRQVARLRLGDAGDRRQRHRRHRRRAQGGAGPLRQAEGNRAPDAAGQGCADHREPREGAFRPRRSWRMGRAHYPNSNRLRRRPMANPSRTLAMGQDEATAADRASVDAPFGQALVEAGARPAGDRRPHRRPRQVHRHPAVPRRLSRPLLQRRHGGAEPRRDRRRTRADRQDPLRHDLRRLRHAARLRLHRHRRRPQPAQREDHRRASRPRPPAMAGRTRRSRIWR